MVDPIPEEERLLEEAIREALSDVSPPPRELCARVRLAVHAEAVREPIRARRSFRISAALTFAFACMIGFIIRQTVTEKLQWNRSHNLSVAAITEPAAHAADRQALIPQKSRSNTNESADTNPTDVRPWHNPSIEASSPTSRDIPRLASLSRDNAEPARTRNKDSSQSIWKHENWSVLEVPVDIESAHEPSSSIHISVTDPIEGQVRSLQMAREFRDGEIHSNIEYETKPVLISGGQ